MQERDTYTTLRETLMNAEVQAPDFDSLFGKEVLGSDPLRTVIATKLADHTAEAPSFDSLFTGEALGMPVQTSKIRMFPWWGIAGVAAACLAVFFLLPDKLGNEIENLSIAPSTEYVKLPSRRAVQTKKTFQPKMKAQILATPSIIELLSVEPNNSSVQASMAENASGDELALRDTTDQRSLIKIRPTRTTRLAVGASRPIDEAYADARIRKTRIKPDKMTFGIGMNSANRLLSMVNSKGNSVNALQSVANDVSVVYASLEGASASKLRSSTDLPNTWQKPGNIEGAMIGNYETNYILPLHFGLTVSIPIVHDLNLITGLQYTYLSNHITGNTFDLKQELHYLGIPVKIAVNMVKRGDFVVYSAIGGAIEKGLAGVQTSTVEGAGEWKGTQSISGFQTSLTGQFGVSYNLNTSFLLYFEPGVAWSIPSDQPISNRTEEPFNFNLSLGIRYRLQ